MGSHVICTYRVPAELEEAAVALLWGEGCEGVQELGVEAGRSTFEAYFPAGLEAPVPRLAGIELLGCRDLVEGDWLETYRLHARPLEIGRRLLIDPREPDEPGVEVPRGRIVLRLPARQAFGTGSHESTRLILELLEEVPLAEARVLDVGSGSGILSFAALALGAGKVVGLDPDLPSAFLSGQYRRLNGSEPAFFAGRLSDLEAPRGFDFLLVNILPERILPEARLLPPLLADGGEILLSGILHRRGEEVLGAMQGLGFRPVARRREGDWVAFRCRR